MGQLNEYQATVLRRAWFRMKLETRSIVAPNKTQALKDATRLYPKGAQITVKFIRTVKPH